VGAALLSAGGGRARRADKLSAAIGLPRTGAGPTGARRRGRATAASPAGRPRRAAPRRARPRGAHLLAGAAPRPLELEQVVEGNADGQAVQQRELLVVRRLDAAPAGFGGGRGGGGAGAGQRGRGRQHIQDGQRLQERRPSCSPGLGCERSSCRMEGSAVSHPPRQHGSPVRLQRLLHIVQLLAILRQHKPAGEWRDRAARGGRGGGGRSQARGTA
jgi:hypothetical protein